MTHIVDVQETRDLRQVPLTRAGLKGLRLPISVEGRDGAQATTATVNVYASLVAEKRGVHLSKLTEAALRLRAEPVNASRLAQILEFARGDAEMVVMEISFDFFLEKCSPVSKLWSPLDYQVLLTGTHTASGFDLVVQVTCPVMSLCPDSKELSEHGAHNQRSFVTICVRGDAWIEDLIEHGERCGSVEIFQVLKKLDDKFVTERSYENPKFVEDMVRDAYLSLQADERVRWFQVYSENLESNHNYNAYAEAECASPA